MTPRLWLAIAPLALSLACAATPAADAGTTTESASEASSSSSESSETASSEAPDTDTDSGDFVPGEDWADTGSCDPFAQDCPEEEKCVPYDWDADDDLDDTKCVLVQGQGGAGEACVFDGFLDATDDCDIDHFCYPVGPDENDVLIGSCAQFCQGTADNPVCPDMFGCYNDRGSLTVCVPTCDPLIQDCADVNALCQWDGYFDFLCIQRRADVGLGQACALANDCAPGSLCLEAALVPGCAGESCCASYCEVGVMGGCDAQPGTTCEPYFPQDPPPGHELVGVCLGP